MDWILQFLPLSIERLNIWIGAICTLAIYSILYRENPFYRLFEHLFIGLAAGYALGPSLVDVIYRYWWEPITKEGVWWLSFVVPFGLYLYFIYNEKYGWISRLVIGSLIGAYSGLTFQAFSSRYLPQLHGALTKPLWLPSKDAEDIFWSNIFNNWIFIIILLAVLIYFTFSFEHRGVIKRTATFGRWFLMIGLGAIFGNTVMARMALLIGRIYYLLSDWLGIQIGGR